jgi:hypothetical protein
LHSPPRSKIGEARASGRRDRSRLDLFLPQFALLVLQRPWRSLHLSSFCLAKPLWFFRCVRIDVLMVSRPETPFWRRRLDFPMTRSTRARKRNRVREGRSDAATEPCDLFSVFVHAVFMSWRCSFRIVSDLLCFYHGHWSNVYTCTFCQIVCWHCAVLISFWLLFFCDALLAFNPLFHGKVVFSLC